MTIKHRYTYPYKIMVLTPTNKTLCVASLVIIDSYVHTNLHSYIIDQTCNHRQEWIQGGRGLPPPLESVGRQQRSWKMSPPLPPNDSEWVQIFVPYFNLIIN